MSNNEGYIFNEIEENENRKKEENTNTSDGYEEYEYEEENENEDEDSDIEVDFDHESLSFMGEEDGEDDDSFDEENEENEEDESPYSTPYGYTEVKEDEKDNADDDGDVQGNQGEKRKKSWKSIFLIFFMVFLFVSSLGIGYYFFNLLFNPKLSPDNLVNDIKQAEAVEEKEPEPENKTYNFLILGVDKRFDDVGRSDTIIVLSVNMAKKKIGLISVPRDSYVEIPNHGMTKINHAYAYGQAELSRQMVENTLGIKIDNYIVFNFRSFKNIIDKLGGVDLNVDKDMYYRDDWDGEKGFVIDLHAGPQHLDGEKAIQYIRYRDEEGDIGRVRRQQTFLSAVLETLTYPKTVTKIPGILRECFSSFETDLKFSDIFELASYLRPHQKYQIQTVMVPGYPDMIDDISYWIIDQEVLQESLFELDDFINQSPLDDANAGKKEALLAEKTDEKKEEQEKEQKEKSSSDPERIDVTKKSGNDTGEQKRNARASIFKGTDKEDRSSLDWKLSELGRLNTEKAEKNRIEQEAKEKLLAEEMRAMEEEAERQRYRERFKTNFVLNENNNTLSGVRIINTTDDLERTDVAMQALESNNIEVSMVNNRRDEGSSNDRTIFIVSSNNDKIASVLNSLPFRFTVMYKNNTDISTLIIGQDFYK